MEIEIASLLKKSKKSEYLKKKITQLDKVFELQTYQCNYLNNILMSMGMETVELIEYPVKDYDENEPNMASE